MPKPDDRAPWSGLASLFAPLTDSIMPRWAQVAITAAIIGGIGLLGWTLITALPRALHGV